MGLRPPKSTFGGPFCATFFGAAPQNLGRPRNSSKIAIFIGKTLQKHPFFGLRPPKRHFWGAFLCHFFWDATTKSRATKKFIKNSDFYCEISDFSISFRGYFFQNFSWRFAPRLCFSNFGASRLHFSDFPSIFEIRGYFEGGGFCL